MSYKEETLRRYLEDLAARTPAPGGGSAAALSAAMGAALISMVVNFTLGKPKYAEYEKELKEILEKSEQLRNEFLNLVDLDVTAYKSKNLRDTLDVCFMLARLCFEAIKLCLPLIKKSNPNLISDVSVAAILLEGAFASSYFNVMINLRALNDKTLTQKICKELKRKENSVKRARLKTEEEVGKIIAG